MKLRYTFLMLICMVVPMELEAQLQVQLSMAPRPSPYLSDWKDKRETATLIVTNPTQDKFFVKLHTRIIQGGITGELQAQTIVEKMPVLMIEPGISVYDATEMFPYEAMEFYGRVNETVIRTGKLPADDYTVCVMLMDAEMNEPLTIDQCRQFFITDYQTPILLQPENFSEIKQQSVGNIIFRWATVIPQPTEQIIYKVAVFEVLPGQSPDMAFQANFPILTKEVTNNNFTLWTPDFEYPQPGLQYIWSVRAIDSRGNPVGQNDGWADPFVFTVAEPSSITDSDCSCSDIKQSIERSDCNSCYSIFVNGIAMEFDCSIPYYLADINSYISVSTMFTADCGRHEWRLQGTVFKEKDDFTGDDASLSQYTTERIDVLLSNNVNAEFEAFAYGKYELLHYIDDMLVTRYSFYTDEPPRTTIGQPRPKNSIIIVTPQEPCIGVVDNDIMEGFVNITWESVGKFIDFEITVLENPCGRYRYPIPGTEPPVKVPAMSRVPYDGEEGGGVIREVHKEKNPARETTPGGRATQSAVIPIADIVAGGTALIVQITGTAESENGELFDVFSEPVCLRYRPLDSEGVPVEPMPCFPPHHPPDSLGKACLPRKKTLPGSPISLGAYIENTKLFEYPRAVAMTADAVDWDIVEILCNPNDLCPETRSFKQFAVRDRVSPGQYKWELIGKGSLNAPFDVGNINSLNKDISDLIRQIASLQEKLDSLTLAKNNYLNTLKTQQDNARNDTANVSKRIKELQDELNDIKSKITAKRDSLQTIIDKRINISDRISEKRDSVDVILLDSIAVYDELLLNKPSQYEIALYGQIADARDIVEQAKEDLRQSQINIADESKRLQEAISQAFDEVRLRESTVNQISQAIEFNQQKVVQFERQAYKLFGQFASIARNYLRERDQYRRTIGNFIMQNFEQGTAFYDSLNNLSQLSEQLAENIIGSTNMQYRLTTFGVFDSVNTNFIISAGDSCQAKADSLRRSLCTSSLTFLSSNYTLYRQTLHDAITRNYTIDTSAEDSIKFYRNAIRSYEPQLQAAKNQLEQAFNTYNQALINDSTTIAQLAEAQNAIRDTITAREQRLITVQTELRDTTQTREDKFATKRIDFVNNRTTFEELRQYLIVDISRLSDTLQINRSDSTICLTEIMTLQNDSTITERNIKIEEELLKTLQDILNTNSKDAEAKYTADSTKIENEIKNLRDKLKAIQDSLALALNGTKTAIGSKVYYIPPPLEEIMKDKATFDTLKTAVNQAEIDLQSARLAKEVGQQKLSRMLERIGRSLMQYVNAEHKISELEGSKKEAEDKKDEENEDLKDYQDELNKIKQTAKSAKDTAESKLTKLDPAESLAKLNEINQDIITKKIDIADALLDFQKSYNELINKSSSLGQYRSQLQSLSKQYETLLDQATELKNALAQSQNEVARIRALNDYARAQFANANLEKNEQSYKAQQDKIKLLADAIESLIRQHSNTTNQQSDAENEFMEKIKKVADKMQELNDLYETYFVQWNEYRAEKWEEAHWKVVKVKADDLTGKTNDAEKQLSQMAKADSLNKEFDVTKIDDQLRKYKDIKSNADSTIAKIVKEGKEQIDKWDQDIKDAEDNLKKRKQDLSKFLEDEFEKVNLTVQFKITVNDDIVDHFRHDDDEKFIIKELKYLSKREPTFDNSKPDISPPIIDEKNGECQVKENIDKDPPLTGTDPVFFKDEPRTIALVYKNGEPLWHRWAVIPQGTPILSKDVVIAAGSAQDVDEITIRCRTECSTRPIKDAIIELPRYIWHGDGEYYQINKDNLEQQFLAYWEPPDVPKNDCEKKFEIKNDFTASRKGPDEDVKDKKTKINIKPGVLIEVPDKLIGWQEKVDTVKVRLVKGDHSGLSGETIEFSVKLLEGQAEDYGFPNDTVKTEKTDGNGYAKLPFNFGKGFARFHITVKWYRADTCEIRTFEAESPLKVQMLRFASGLSKEALDGAMEVWEGKSVQDVAKNMSVEDEKRIYGIAGLFDNFPNFINEESLIFSIDDENVSIDPDSTKTKLFGIGATYLDGDIPENAKFELTARCDEVYKSIAEPYEDKMELNTTKEEKFKIGIGESLFTVVMDDGFSPGELISGTGKLEITPGGLNLPLLTELLNIILTADDVFVEEVNGELIAQTGRVTWEATDGLSVELPGFKFTLDSLSLRAKQAAQIGGKISSSSDKLPHPVGFDAELYTSGEFFGNIYNLPEISISSFTLRQGTSLAIDWSSTRSVEAFALDYKGVVIRTAKLEFPNAFNKSDTKEKLVLAIENFGINSDGVKGKLDLTGEVKAGFAGFELTFEQLTVEFELGKIIPQNLLLAGKLKPPENIADGTLDFKIIKSGDDWIGEVTTKGDLLIPSLGLTIALDDGTRSEWNAEKNKGLLVINGKFHSKFTGEVVLDNLRINSEGEIEADAVRLKTDASLVVRGFNMNLDEIAFVRIAGEASTSQYAFQMMGGFGFPQIAIQKISGKLSILPGIKLQVDIDTFDIAFNYGPVDFKGKIRFGNNYFAGNFDVGLSQPKFGMGCSFIIGTQEIDPDNYFTYWYAEMQLSMGQTGIPLGTTGLSITRLGGGVGWNYDPPVGSQKGTSRKTDGFAFKALIGIGTTPGGKILNSLFTMVYSPSKFSLGGKLWLLEQEDNIFAEGVLNLYFDSQSPNAIDGFVKSFVGIPDAEAKIIRLDGKINYEITRNGNLSIQSETLNGSILDLLRAEGNITINENLIDLNGRIFLDFYSDDISLAGVLTLIVDFHAEASGSFKYMNKQKRLFAGVKFAGHIDINLDTPFGVADILSARTEVNMLLRAQPGSIEATGFGFFSYNAWIYSGNAKVDFGFKI